MFLLRTIVFPNFIVLLILEGKQERMIKNMYKKADYQGRIIADSSPSGIEKFLKTTIENALGGQSEGVKIRPILKIDEYASDMSGDVKTGYGAVVLDVMGTLVHIPFMMRDREFVPFDSIRMGGQQVAYEEGKLKKLVKSLKEVSEEEGEEDEFEAYSLAEDMEDLPFDNGFLGTIMSIRDDARRHSNQQAGMYTHMGFGDMTDERMLRTASVDIGETLSEFHEKLANVKTYTEDDIKKVAAVIREQAIKDYDDVLQARSTMPEDRTQELLRREARKIELVDFRVANNGKCVEFPVVDGSSSTRSAGILYKDVARPITDSQSATKGYNALLIDSKGSFKLIHDKDNLLIYKDRKLSDVNLKFGEAIAMRGSKHYHYSMYLNEDKTRITTPFKVLDDYISNKEQSGLKTFYKYTEDDGAFFTSVQSTLFQNALQAEDILGDFASWSSRFVIMIARVQPRTRANNQIEEGVYEYKELIRLIRANAENERDVNVSMDMLNMFSSRSETSKVYVVYPKTKIINFKDAGIKTISKREELLPFEKVASFDSQDKLRVYINENQTPPVYNVNIRYTEAADADGFSAKRTEQNNINHLSEMGLKKVLSDLGVSHTDIDEMIAGVKRNGRYAEVPLPNKDLAKNYEYKDSGNEKAKKAIEGMVRETLNANNFLPVMKNVVSDTITEIANGIINYKTAGILDVATGMEKRANETRDPFDAEVAGLLNMKYHLDKLACEIHDGFVVNAEEVYETLSKVAHVIPHLSEELYYRQMRGKDNLYKQAMLELDGLTQHNLAGSYFIKEAKVKKLLNKAKKKMKTKKDKDYDALKSRYADVDNQLNDLKFKRSKESPKIAMGDKDAARNVKEYDQQMKSLMDEQVNLTGDITEVGHSLANRNRAVMAGTGLPTVSFASYKINDRGE